MSKQEQQNVEFRSKSIWGDSGNPAIADDAKKDAMRAEGNDFKDPLKIKSKAYKEAYKEGVVEYKEDKMTQLLEGKISSDKVDTLDIDRIFGRTPSGTPKTSKGGIILKA